MEVIKRLEAKQAAAGDAANACIGLQYALTRFIAWGEGEGEYLMLALGIDIAEYTGNAEIAILTRKVIVGTEDPENLYAALKATWYKQRCLERLCYVAGQYKRNPSEDNLKAYAEAYSQYQGIE